MSVVPCDINCFNFLLILKFSLSHMEFNRFFFLLLLFNNLRMPPHSCLATIIFADNFTLNVVNNLFVISRSSPAAFRVLSLSLAFYSSIIVCLSVATVVFILLGVHGISCLCRVMPSIKFGKFLAIISSNTLSFSHFLLSHWDFYSAYVGSLDGVLQAS